MSEVLILQQGNTAERNPEDDVPCPCPLTACRAFRNKNSGSRAGLLNTGYVQVPSVLLVKVYISPRGRHCPYTHFTDELADGKASGVTWADRAAGRGGAGSSGGRCPDCRTQSATLSDAQIRRQRPGSWATPPRRKSPHCRDAQGTEAVPPPWVQEAGMLGLQTGGAAPLPIPPDLEQTRWPAPGPDPEPASWLQLAHTDPAWGHQGTLTPPARSATIFSWALGTEEWLVLQKQPRPRRKPRSCAQPSPGSHSAHGPAETRRSLSVWGLRFLNG